MCKYEPHILKLILSAGLSGIIGIGTEPNRKGRESRSTFAQIAHHWLKYMTPSQATEISNYMGQLEVITLFNSKNTCHDIDL